MYIWIQLNCSSWNMYEILAFSERRGWVEYDGATWWEYCIRSSSFKKRRKQYSQNAKWWQMRSQEKISTDTLSLADFILFSLERLNKHFCIYKQNLLGKYYLQHQLSEPVQSNFLTITLIYINVYSADFSAEPLNIFANEIFLLCDFSLCGKNLFRLALQHSHLIQIEWYITHLGCMLIFC